MTYPPYIDPAYSPLTVGLLARGFMACGLTAGQHVVVHTKMSALGWIVGGAVALIEALQRVITPSGTIMMPAFTSENSDPSQWSNPPIPESWWQIVRDTLPPYDPARTPTWGLGVVPELFRTLPGVVRSAHPEVSWAAWGARAAFLTADHTLETEIGDGSPLSKLYDLAGYVLLIGVDHGNNSSLHLAEYRANWARKRTIRQGAAMVVNGARQWVEYDSLHIDDSDFAQLGADYEREHGIAPHRVGRAEVRLLRQRPLIDYAVTWLERNRTE
ncbi:MAG: AAC(3) family N-acetyltransferase [Chloroflexota bacterium]|nr:AAC(3) family N-acetyltransferase [Chloroflexota bacterium]